MNRTVLITGACINTGVAIVEKFASEGWNVVFTGRNAEQVEKSQKIYREKFPSVNILGYAINSLIDDRTVNEQALDHLFKDLDDKNIFVECVVLNAADQGLGMKVFENPLTDFVRVFNVNVTWNYAIIERACLKMKGKGGGNVVLVNSNTAYRAIPDRIAYVTSKGGQLGMMRALALDLGKYNIRVNAVLPGMIRTERWDKNPDFYKDVPSRFSPLPCIIDGEDIANAVWYLCHAEKTTGAELVLDAGNTVQLYPIIPKEI